MKYHEVLQLLQSAMQFFNRHGRHEGSMDADPCAHFTSSHLFGCKTDGNESCWLSAPRKSEKKWISNQGMLVTLSSEKADVTCHGVSSSFWFIHIHMFVTLSSITLLLLVQILLYQSHV